MDDRYTLIYRSSLHYSINIMKLCSVIVATAATAVIVAIFYNWKNTDFSTQMIYLERSLQYSDILIFSIALVLQLSLILKVIRQYPMRIYKLNQQ